MKGNVLYREEDGIGVVTVNRPEVHNALNMQTIRELRELLLRLEAEDALRAMVLTGSGKKTFLSGGDIKEFQKIRTVEEARVMIATMKEATDLLAGFPWPVIAAITGLAVGGGCETAIACDFRIASETAEMGFRQIKLGIMSGWGGGPRLVHLVGRSRALRPRSSVLVLNLSSSSMTSKGMMTSLSAKRKIALGLCNRTLVSTTKYLLCPSSCVEPDVFASE